MEVDWLSLFDIVPFGKSPESWARTQKVQGHYGEGEGMGAGGLL